MERISNNDNTQQMTTYQKYPRALSVVLSLGRITTSLTQLSEALTKDQPALIIAPMFRAG
ncbi:hypothetical protein F441_14205 [Phytophthora nicotianae CJ01A1]|uniref:Uncharacterized protein n=3 Tax=Phytophthora nicotianae TaxID=4792 RepID=V9EP17_PHYNI|nr:hypothetical protein F443_14311 [Phytophthora nicotianae P1569]ETM47493.1 hypothetical protein L914_07804 [Phytophthora nicotianae]ETP10076.1 hypothetical protein F441_14205 [Phytophthora nicotianae CJ01A1]